MKHYVAIFKNVDNLLSLPRGCTVDINSNDWFKLLRSLYFDDYAIIKTEWYLYNLCVEFIVWLFSLI